ncbi:hypothetical protein [Clostridium beijerinckii]|uniref:hypothetical protein n=1 Tax=Clostridium beijerinckii TaxID=1520 RepID=UPI00080A35D5|nr:hypothetical protein [Clostridium beijerinckii]OCA99113.1 hypothetical protein BGS1_19170 [Clostridium beijerinckii]
MNIKFDKMTQKDIMSLVKIMKSAFDYDSQIHLEKENGGYPGYDDGTFLNKWGLDKRGSIVLIKI